MMEYLQNNENLLTQIGVLLSNLNYHSREIGIFADRFLHNEINYPFSMLCHLLLTMFSKVSNKIMSHVMHHLNCNI
jgi:hypothetical protein